MNPDTFIEVLLHKFTRVACGILREPWSDPHTDAKGRGSVMRPMPKARGFMWQPIASGDIVTGEIASAR